MPVTKNKKGRNVGMSMADAQAAAEAREKVEAYQAKKIAESQKTYVVQSGDSLSTIAKEQLGDARRWPEIQKLNNIANANLIRAGQELLLPD